MALHSNPISTQRMTPVCTHLYINVYTLVWTKDKEIKSSFLRKKDYERESRDSLSTHHN